MSSMYGSELPQSFIVSDSKEEWDVSFMGLILRSDR